MMMVTVKNDVVKYVDFHSLYINGADNIVINRKIYPKTTGLTPEQYVERAESLMKGIASRPASRRIGGVTVNCDSVRLNLNFADLDHVESDLKRVIPAPEGFSAEANELAGRIIDLLESV